MDLQIKYEFEMDDWMALQKHHLQQSKPFKNSVLLITILVPVFFSLFLLMHLIRGEFNIIIAIIFAVLSVFWLIFFPKRAMSIFLPRIKRRLENGDNSSVLGWHTLTFTDKDILQIKPELETRIQWSGIQNVGVNDAYIFIYLTTISAIVIPKNKLVNKDLEQLIALLDRKVGLN